MPARIYPSPFLWSRALSEPTLDNQHPDIRIDRRIGDDPEELNAVADAVVRGEPIVNAEIKSLRKLIEAVQAHPDGKLAPPRDERPNDWVPPNKIRGKRFLKINPGTPLTELKINPTPAPPIRPNRGAGM